MRWRSTRVARPARPSGGSTFPPFSDGRSPSRRARTSWSISVKVSRATSSIVSSAARERSGSRSPSSLRRPCLDEDDVDRVTGRVVQVARDPRPLLGGRQPALALGVPLRPLGAGDELGDPLAPQADAVAEHPGAAPDDDAEEERHGREGIFRVADRADVHHEESRDRRGCHPGARAGSLRRQREEEERGGRAEGRPADIAHTVEHRARGGGGDEDREGRAPPTEERERRSSRQHDPEQVDVAHIRVVVRAARRHQRQGQRKGGGGDRRVDEPFAARHESRVTTRSRRRVSLRRMRSPPSGDATSARRAFRSPVWRAYRGRVNSKETHARTCHTPALHAGR